MQQRQRPARSADRAIPRAIRCRSSDNPRCSGSPPRRTTTPTASRSPWWNRRAPPRSGSQRKSERALDPRARRRGAHIELQHRRQRREQGTERVSLPRNPHSNCVASPPPPCTMRARSRRPAAAVTSPRETAHGELAAEQVHVIVRQQHELAGAHFHHVVAFHLQLHRPARDEVAGDHELGAT